jgi:hypothetical protein
MTGLRARPWQPGLYRDGPEGDTLARLAPRQPEPGFVATLLAAADAHPRFARIYAITAALAVVAVLALLGVKG